MEMWVISRILQTIVRQDSPPVDAYGSSPHA
jgi:hypothetical protein